MTKTFKPYDLVVVTQKFLVDPDTGRGLVEANSIGQIISRPIGDGSIMVRRVPDDPATQEMLSLDNLHVVAAPKAYKWVSYAKVYPGLAGCGQFPVDMLRYDCAAPVNFTIAEDEMGRLSTPLKEGVSYGDGLIIGKATVTKSNPKWHPDRWVSFGWKIEPLRTLKLEGK